MGANSFLLEQTALQNMSGVHKSKPEVTTLSPLFKIADNLLCVTRLRKAKMHISYWRGAQLIWKAGNWHCIFGYLFIWQSSVARFILYRINISSDVFSTPMGVDNLNIRHCPENTLWKFMYWSNAIFHGLLNLIITKHKLSKKKKKKKKKKAWSMLRSVLKVD